MHFGCFILPANHKQTLPDTFFCTCTNNQNSHTCLERSFPSRDAIIWRSRQHNPTPSLNAHSCPPLLLRNMLSFDEEKTGSKFQLFLRAPSAINEVNKLPRLKLMRSSLYAGVTAGPPRLRAEPPLPRLLGFSSFICPFSPQHRPFLRPAGDRWGFSLRQDVPMRCKLLFSPFFFYSLLLSLSHSLRIFGLLEISCRCRGTESRHTVGHLRRSLADHRREEQTSKFTQGCVPQDSRRANGSSYRVPFGVFKLVIWFPGERFTVTSLGTWNHIYFVTMATVMFSFRTLGDLEKCSIPSLAHQWIICSEWVPSESPGSKQLIKNITIIHKKLHVCKKQIHQYS